MAYMIKCLDIIMGPMPVLDGVRLLLKPIRGQEQEDLAGRLLPTPDRPDGHAVYFSIRAAICGRAGQLNCDRTAIDL